MDISANKTSFTMNTVRCDHKVVIEDEVVWECPRDAAKGRNECNGCKGLQQRGKIMPVREIEKLVSILDSKLKLVTRQKEELHRDYTDLLKSHAELAISYKNLLETSLVSQMEKSLVIDSASASPILCPKCKKRRRKDPCDCVLP